jgi:hypothetical protein
MIAKQKKGGNERPPREDQEKGGGAPSLDAAINEKLNKDKKEKENEEKLNPLSQDGRRKATEKATVIAMATTTTTMTTTTTTKAASSGVEEGSEDVNSFGKKKKTTANIDCPLDVARKSPLLSLTTAESTATPVKAGTAGVVSQGLRGGGSPADRGMAAVSKDDAEEAGECAERQV